MGQSESSASKLNHISRGDEQILIPAARLSTLQFQLSDWNSMGRTIPTHRMQLEAETSKIRRLAKEKKFSDRTRKILDRMLDYPFLYASAGGFIHRLDPKEPMLLAMVLHHEKMIQELKKRKTTL